jgi:exopolysaccharide biosynthesis polyprenyl glycosylphosphotransferase
MGETSWAVSLHTPGGADLGEGKGSEALELAVRHTSCQVVGRTERHLATATGKGRVRESLEGGVIHDDVATTLRRPPSIGARHDETRQATAAEASSAVPRFRRIAASLVACDALVAVAALLVVHVLTSGPGAVPLDLVVTLSVAPLLWVVVFNSFGLYQPMRVSGWGEFPRILGAVTIAVVFLALAGSWWNQPFTRASVSLTLLMGLSLELLVRSVLMSMVRRNKRDGLLSLRTLILGTNGEAHRVARVLRDPAAGFLPIGFVADSYEASSGNGLPIVGEIDQLEETVRRVGAECLFVASTAVSQEEMLWITRLCRKENIELRVSTNVSDVLTSRLYVQTIEGVTSLTIKPVRLSGTQAMFKRAFDLIVGSIILVLTLPFMVAIAFAIRLTSSGPIFFTQLRVTKNGDVFAMYKFRTMVTNHERALEGKAIDLTQPFFKLEDDPRLTRVGRVLRSLSLDELPQLWNVLRGDMSIVGPRPLPVEQVDANHEFLSPRHEVSGGITGLWQISGRSDLDSDEALRIDRYYIENWSLGLDVYILLKTIGAVLTRRGAW